MAAAVSSPVGVAEWVNVGTMSRTSGRRGLGSVNCEPGLSDQTTTFGALPNTLRMRTLKIRYTWLTVPLTRANTPDASIRTDRPSALTSRTKAVRVARLAPYRADTWPGVRKRR